MIFVFYPLIINYIKAISISKHYYICLHIKLGYHSNTWLCYLCIVIIGFWDELFKIMKFFMIVQINEVTTEIVRLSKEINNDRSTD